mgnify:CR=1 FL=1
MFEDKTFDTIMDEMLSTVDQSIDTRQGSVIYDAVAPVAAELAQAYIDLDMLLSETFADTASYYYLIKRAAEHGIFVKAGTPAVLKVLVSPTTLEITTGTEFNVGELNYTITENLGSGYFSMTCEETGTAGNNTTDDVIPMENVDGLETIDIVGIITAGTDDEDVETLRNRYFDSFSSASFGGNQAEYKEKVDAYAEVTACKVYPAWNGGGTVKLAILGTDYRAAAASVISMIQGAIDPTQDGSGVGIAPIGHIVTVATVTETSVAVACGITYSLGYAWADIKDTVTAKITEYLLNLRATWEDAVSLVVRTGQIESLLLGITGVADVTSITLNGTAGNLEIPATNVPIAGEISG